MRLRRDDRDAEAWREFVDRYGSRIYRWCLQYNLQPSDAEDVTQEVLVKLARKLGQFVYDPNQSFRGWMRRVTENVLNDFFRQRLRIPGVSGAMEMLAEVEAKDALMSELQVAFDLELFDMAVQNVRARISSKRFQVWKRLAVEGEKALDLAKQFDMKVASVYTAKGQIQEMIRQEVARLDRTDALS